jgi:hypothetical protein
MITFFFENFLNPLVFLATSAVFVMLGLKAHLSAGRLWRSVTEMIQAVGLMLFFFLLNTVVGFVTIEIGKRVLHAFVSHYVVVNTVVWWFSLGQALVFRNWIASSEREREARNREV